MSNRKTAILQVADTGPLESLVVMLQAAGYNCYLVGTDLKTELRRIGCDTVLDIDSLVRGWGYDKPMPLSSAGMRLMLSADLYVDVKAHRNYPKVVQRWPNLKDKVLWYRINGGKPEHVIKPSGEDCGDEANPPCPILTPNQWYKDNQRAYTCWPPFYRWDEYKKRNAWNGGSPWNPAVCLLHNAGGWGYNLLFDDMRRLGVKIYGAGSPDGLVQHREVPWLLSTCLCMVHLKSSDAPGYALYEALAAGCPVICTRRLIWRCRMQDLLIPEETCLVFDRETHDGLTEQDVKDCTAEVAGHLDRLRDPAENRRIGEAGRQRLQQIMWNPSRESDVASLKEFLRRHFP